MNFRRSRQRLKTESKIISLRDFVFHIGKIITYLISKWILIGISALLGGGIGLAYAIYMPITYTASSTFVLEDGEKSGLGQYAGIASMVGIDLSGKGGGVFEGDNIIELYKSRTMLEKTFLSPVTVEGRKWLLIDYYISFNNYRKKWDNPALKSVKFTENNDGFNRLQDSLLGVFVNRMNKECLTVSKPDKKLSIIQVEVKSKNENFAKLFNDKIVQNVNEFYIQTKTKKSLNNLQILQHQADSVYISLYRSLGKAVSILDANPSPNWARQIVKLPSQRSQIDAEASKAIYTELVKNLEISKIALQKESPLIQVIDRPKYPLANDKKSKALYIILFAFTFAALQVFIISFKKLLVS